MPFFSKVFKGKDGAAKKNAKANGAHTDIPQKEQWDDAWQRKEVEPEEVQGLLRGCTQELKARGLDLPFLLLPFRPASDPSAARTFIRNFFGRSSGRHAPIRGDHLAQELRLAEPLVICSVMKWCWSRLAGGVVTWEAYELFKIGEQDSDVARDAFATFIPISVASDARTKIIFDFFELLSAIAAHGKTNGLGGRKLSRYAGWWAFEHTDLGNGFDGGYKTWQNAADATSHLFFAYLRSLSPDSVQGKNGISALPLSLQQLVEATEYPPLPQGSLQSKTSKVVMIVDTVSPTPFSLLRRAKNFHYREDDMALQQFSDYDDPVDALTDECRRVLKGISSANDSSNANTSTSLRDASWSRFEDIGFGGFGEDFDHVDEVDESVLGKKPSRKPGLRTTPASKNDLGRPTTPSWADFLSSGFNDESQNGGPRLLLPPDKVLPPINTRGQSSQSHKRMTDDESLEPGELASITTFELDDTFWWVWITSLAGEESLERKAVFGRCALIETDIRGGRWLVMEEIIKGAAPEPDAGAYIAEKKSRFGFSRRGKLSRSKSSGKGALPKTDAVGRSNMASPMSKTSIAPDQHARIQAAAAALQLKNHTQSEEFSSPRRARHAEDSASKTNSVLTLQPIIMNEAAPAMKWASTYDKNTIRAKYLGDNFAGRGSANDLLSSGASAYAPSTKENVPPPPAKATPTPRDESKAYAKTDPGLVDVINSGPDQGRRVQNHGQPQSQRTPTQAPSTVESVNVPASQSAPLTTSTIHAAPVSAPPAIPAKNTEELPAQISHPSTQQPQSMPSSPEYPRSTERNPAVPPKQEQEVSTTTADPSSFKSGPEYSQYKTSNGTANAAPPSPESPKASHNKLKKKNQPSGFKGLFGRKKADQTAKQPTQAPPSNSSAVAAARAALEAKAAQSQQVPPPTKTSAKRFSTIGKKRTPEAPMEVYSPPSPMADLKEERPVSTIESTPYDSRVSISAADPSEERRAEQEFQSFDQGPLEDVPAFAADDSPRDSAVPSEQPYQEETRMSADDGMRDDVSDMSNEDVNPIVSPNDRWAQIRKNAAERAAVRQSEEQSRQTDRTDDGETSGEETIESRVARIKARVAELTGNMETPSPPSSRR